MNKMVIGALAFVGLAVTAGAAQAGATFDAVKARGTLNCGVHTGLGGFGAPDAQGNWSGLDVDMCRAVATAMFGDPTKVKFSPLTTAQRFTALQSGEIDMLARNTTWTLTREADNGLLFAATNYYDGQGFLATKKLGVKSAKELKGATVCVQQGTTTEQNLADYSRANSLDIKPVTFDSFDAVVAAYNAGRCDSFTSDRSQLAAARANNTANADDHVILPEVISKEPLAVAVRQGDDQWYNVVKYSFQAMLYAEEKGINSKNVESMKASADPDIKKLLGVTAGIGKGMNINDAFAYNIIKSVGNYGESFDRNVGAGSKLKLDRGVNDLWTKGGLMYALPITR